MKRIIYFVLLLVLANMCFGASTGRPSCGGSSSSKEIELINPKYPPRECVYNIQAYSDFVCQLRIEFSYNLAQPSLPSENKNLKYVKCEKDYFQVGDMRLCGTESSQHIYLPFNRTAGVKSVDISLALANRAGVNSNLPAPKWEIYVKQLECPAGAAIRGFLDPLFGSHAITDGFLVAPPGCLQYFPHSEGSVTSFNFGKGKGVYPGKLNYAICFRRTENTKALVFKLKFFRLGANQHCKKSFQSDYLMIPQADVEDSGERGAYFCGNILDGHEVFSKNPGPLVILFNSEGNNINPSGFDIDYNVIAY